MNLHLSETLKQLRKDKNMTQEDVASSLGVTYQSVSRWETGLSYPDIELLPSIAALFDVSLDILFGTDPESEAVKIRKYEAEDEKLGNNHAERIMLVKRYIAEIPKSAYLKYCLMKLYHDAGPEYAVKKLDEMRTLCRYIADHMTERDHCRDYAIGYMIDVEDEDKVGEWYSLLDKRSVLTSLEAERERYHYRGEVDRYNRIIQNHLYDTMAKAFVDDFCKRDQKTYKNAQSRVDGQKVILKIIDAMRTPEIEMDAWVYQRELAYRRLAAGCFGAGYIDEGYAAMEKSIDICLAFCKLPVGTVLKYNSPVLDLLTRTVKEDDGPEVAKNAYRAYTQEKGWEWFNCVRDEERYLSQVARLKTCIDQYQNSRSSASAH